MSIRHIDRVLFPRYLRKCRYVTVISAIIIAFLSPITVGLSFYESSIVGAIYIIASRYIWSVIYGVNIP